MDADGGAGSPTKPGTTPCARYSSYDLGMDDSLADGTYVTLGRRFRTPTHPQVLAALGRAVYNFVSLEESVSAIIFDSGADTLSSIRGKMAGDKQKALTALADRYRRSASGEPAAEALSAAAAAFGEARQNVRNILLHAHPYTAGEDAKSNYLPGLAYTARDGESWKTACSYTVSAPRG